MRELFKIAYRSEVTSSVRAQFTTLFMTSAKFAKMESENPFYRGSVKSVWPELDKI